jgi:polyketide synthase PksN
LRASLSDQSSNSAVTFNERIAIIGLSGRYPGADTLEEFWENLKGGVDSITEIPKDRWAIEGFYAADKEELGKSYSKWGGFIKDVDKFDPLFFNISPREAEAMDPQERLFLQMVWAALEDGGYTQFRLQESTLSSSIGGAVGVYAGVMYEEYQLYGVEESLRGNPLALGGSPSSVANRVSYFLNLHGPSIALDTMCSSSLTAIHLAIEALHNGQCMLAIAGGVNVSIHPNKYRMLSQGRFVSDKGRCESFGEGGNGYVPAEGVGVVLLKPLWAAERDGDRIYGLIRGSSVNHGGKTNGYTVPNPKAQAQVIQQAMDRARVKAKDISYIEAHGTGTSLGDPIEIAGLSKAFELDGKEGQWCSVGSLKSNIGHAESAAGIGGVTKVLLQMQHKQLVPSLHSETLNPHIDFGKTPFRVQRKLEAWATDNNQPRIAGVSSFGAGGSNAHIIVEEYLQKPSTDQSTGPFIIPLSARNEERLLAMVGNLLSWLEVHDGDFNLDEVAYTLQVGREAMESRLALVVNNLEELKTQLAIYQKGERKGLLTGNIKKEPSDFLLEGGAGQAYISYAIKNRETRSLAQLWVKGVSIDWSLLYGEGNRPQKISLPSYPFAKERYWIPAQEDNSSTLGLKKIHLLHPLLHQNVSDLSEQKYTSVFTGKEGFLSHHKVAGEKMFPGVAYLELAREAGERSIHQSITQLIDVTWLNSVRVNGQPQEVHTSVFEEGSGLGYEIYSKGEAGEEVIHGQGSLSTKTLTLAEAKDIASIQSRLTGERSGEECYRLFRSLGLDYGTTFRGIGTLYYSKQEALSKLTLPKQEDYVLQPGLLDSALQTCLGISLASGKEAKQLLLPFSVKEVNIYGAVGETRWAYARRRKGHQAEERVAHYDIDMLSQEGEVLVSFQDFVMLAVGSSEPNGTGKSRTEVAELHYYSSVWQAEEVVSEKIHYGETVIIIAGGPIALAEALTDRLAQGVIAIGDLSLVGYYLRLQALIQEKLTERQSTQILVLYGNDRAVDYGFVSGMLKTAWLENSKLSGKTIGIESLSLNDLDILVDIIEKESQDVSTEVRYVSGQREIKVLSPLEITSKEIIPIKAGGVYLITGGSGGLGKILAGHIAGTQDTTLILTGRRESNPLSAAVLGDLHATYHSCDVTDQRAVANLIEDILQTHGRLDGIIHSAGLIRDSFLIKKKEEEAESVLLPKIAGVKHLDESTKDLDLDFVVYCSSVAGVIGNVGQADYASANAYMDDYARYRNELVSKGKRSGQTVSINWPLWEEGGMQVDSESEKYIERTWGMQPLPTEKALTAFTALLQQASSQAMAVYGLRSKLAKVLCKESVLKRDKTP